MSAVEPAENQGHPVLVVGGGIAGMQAALDLAAMSLDVVLLERSPTLGGNMTRLDKTFPTNDCSMCMISPRMVACSRNPRIRIRTLAELIDVEGAPGDFLARVRVLPRYVDEAACIGCRQCVEKCPKSIANAYNAGLDQRKAIYMVHSQATPLVPVIDPLTCIYFLKGRCRACEKICPTRAIRFDDRATTIEIPASAVILAGGYQLGLVPQAGEYGYQRYANVVTNIDYERMLSATGPYGGHPRRPSDGGEIRRVAWIQCVASRDAARNRNFCSSVCCMAAVKQALLTREHDPECDAAIFYMDIRAQGKDFDRYVLRAAETYGVRFVHSMLSQVIEDPSNRNLVLQYYDRQSMEHRQEEFDLVVLSVGMKPSAEAAELLERLGIEVNRYGFVATGADQPCHTSREGILVCGTLSGPKDIPESVAQASAAAGSAALPLAGARSSRQPEDEPPEVLDESSEEPRIGVFVCHCGRNIAGVVDVEALRDKARTLPHVVVAEDFMFTCSTQTQERMQELIRLHRLNRVVVAACSPRTHEPLFQETLKQAGLNKYLFEMANIRDQCSWVHSGQPEAATDKAGQLIEAAVARATLLEPIRETVTRVVPRALVIGGGLAGMTAALALADQEIAVTLVEKDSRPGGMARHIHRTLEGLDPRRLAEQLAMRVKHHRHLTLRNESRIMQLSGGAGQFTALIRQDGATVAEDFGAVVVATGGEPYRPIEHLYGRDPRVLTQLELEQRLHARSRPLPESVVMIQCVGSRNEEFPLCSRVCCAGAVKNAIHLLEINPAASVYVLYRDIRTFGFKEEYYKRARDLGALFVKFQSDRPPEIEADDGHLRVRVFDPGSRLQLAIQPDLLVLSGGVRPRPESREIAGMLKLPTMAEGFFIEAHPKLSPLDFSSPGVFLCGLAHSPMFIEETLIQAQGAACRAAALLLKDRITSGGIVAEVLPERCSGCLACVHACPYQVPVVVKGISSIDPRGCKGCGICAAECPAKAIVFKHYTDDQVNAQAGGGTRVKEGRPPRT